MDADVVVIGAGAAGLAAARKLATGKLSVVVLECRDRVGGRVWSRQIPTVATPAELGAEFIHGPAKETLALLRELGISSAPSEGESWLRRGDELRREESDFISPTSLFDAARSSPKDESVDQFLRRFEKDDATREMARGARGFVEAFDAADPAIASVHGIADELHSGVDSKSARPIGGYGPIIKYLRDACVSAGSELCLSTMVRRISWCDRRVSVATSAASGGTQNISARAAIITLPVGVLKHNAQEYSVAFEPELPAFKQESLSRLEMGPVVKVVLGFRSIFWEQIEGGRLRDAEFFRADGQSFAAFWTQIPLHTELIVAWAGGPQATALGACSEAELIERALNEFGKLLGERKLAREEFAGYAMHNWQSDPFARGAYSYVLVGGGKARAQLAAPIENTLFFAGEATSSDGQGGTVNGALETGERAAGEVVAALGASGDKA